MLEAADIFPRLRDRLMKAAIDAGTITWERGLIFKGNSLCHGIAGNGYLLHSIYRAFLEEKRRSMLVGNAFLAEECDKIATVWKTRAFMFGKAICDPQI